MLLLLLLLFSIVDVVDIVGVVGVDDDDDDDDDVILPRPSNMDRKVRRCCRPLPAPVKEGEQGQIDEEGEEREKLRVEAG